MPSSAPLALSAPRAPGLRRCERRRLELADGKRTTLYVAAYDSVRTAVRVVRLAHPAPLAAWCRASGISDGLVGGFFARPAGTPLGELRVGGTKLSSLPFDDPWARLRACVHITGSSVEIAGLRDIQPGPSSDVLQAGPLLVADGRPAVSEGVDSEGFSAGAHQFDSDISIGRYPRAALAVADGRVLALVCDGRADDDAGLTLAELADVLVALGARAAINLDGGGSASLVCDGALWNRPREEHGLELAGGRPISTALVFSPAPA